MYLKYSQQVKSRARLALQSQSGLGLPSALFLIVVVMLIVAAINQLNELNAQAYGREWLSMRAFYAAESGAQTAAVYALNPAQVMPVCDNNFIVNLDLSNTGLETCDINVSCMRQTVLSESYVTLTSTGRCGFGPDQATRVIQVRLIE